MCGVLPPFQLPCFCPEPTPSGFSTSTLLLTGTATAAFGIAIGIGLGWILVSNNDLNLNDLNRLSNTHQIFRPLITAQPLNKQLNASPRTIWAKWTAVVHQRADRKRIHHHPKLHHTLVFSKQLNSIINSIYTFNS
jgi:hypothetical protein